MDDDQISPEETVGGEEELDENGMPKKISPIDGPIDDVDDDDDDDDDEAV